MRDRVHETLREKQLVGLGAIIACTCFALALPAYGQMSPEEHASHHPGQADGASPAGEAGPTPGATPNGAGGMGGMMEGMMEKMGAPKPKELYPTLMSFPDLTPERREEILDQANERMHSGALLLSKGVDRLTEAAETDDYAAMQEATARMHEALAGFESGVAARRALAEGQPPRQVALQWFKGEMSLQPPQGVEARGLMGATLFHLFGMGLLIVFALAMVALYFFKMRRAAALFGRIEANKGAPPPGAAPALAGTAPPAATPAGKPAADATGTST